MVTRTARTAAEFSDLAASSAAAVAPAAATGLQLEEGYDADKMGVERGVGL